MSRRIEKRRAEERRSEKRKSEKKEDPGARKGRKVAKHCVFPMICGSGGSKSRLAKAAGAEPAGQMRDKKLHAVVARSTFASEKAKNTSRSEHCWKLRCRKSAVVARSAFASEKAKSTSRSEHFWKLRCGKSARRCGAKHISIGSCDVEKVHAVVARSTFPSQNIKKTRGDHFWRFRCRFAWQAQGIVDLVKSEQNVRVL